MATLMPDRKVIAVSEEAHKKISEGLRKAGEVVASTLGPHGRLVMVDKKHQKPEFADDGKTAVDNLILEDELENLAVLALCDAAEKTSEMVGDGTSTTMVLLRAIYESSKQLLSNNPFVVGAKTPLDIWKEIRDSKKVVSDELSKMARKVETKEEIKFVAHAAYADEEMAETIADLVERCGKNGVILVDEGWGRETEVSIKSGMRVPMKVPSDQFLNTKDLEFKVNNLPILLCDFKLETLEQILSIMNVFQACAKAGEKGLVVIASNYGRPTIDQIVTSNAINIRAWANQPNKTTDAPFLIHLLKSPSSTPEEFKDLAVYLGATFFSKEKGDKLELATPSDLGRADEIRVTKYGDGLILGGAGTEEAKKARIEEVRILWEKERVKMIKNRIQQRIGDLAASVATISVASPSEGETSQIKLKVQNAVKSAQAAVAEGIVPGGGLALKQIAEKLPLNILTEALSAPYDLIQKNAGGRLEISETIFDPVKVTRTALEQACSQAWLLINTYCVIAHRSEKDGIDAADIIAKGLGNFDPRKPSEKFKDEYGTV